MGIVVSNSITSYSNDSQLTMMFYKNWSAQQLMTSILKKIVKNPVVGYAFFADIIQYIRDNEMSKEQSESMNDLSIIKTLKPNRFLICDQDDGKAPIVYYMKDKYEISDSLSPTEYTNLRLRFLVKNDPFILQKKQKTKAIWIHFKKTGCNSNNSYHNGSYGIIRSVFYKQDSYKDIILRDVVPCLNSISNVKYDYDEKIDSDLLFGQIMKTHTVSFESPHMNTKKIPLDSLLHSMHMDNLNEVRLVVSVPPTNIQEQKEQKEDEVLGIVHKNVQSQNIPNFIFLRKEIEIKRLKIEASVKIKKLTMKLNQKNDDYKQLEMQRQQTETKKKIGELKELILEKNGKINGLKQMVIAKDNDYKQLEMQNDKINELTQIMIITKDEEIQRLKRAKSQKDDDYKQLEMEYNEKNELVEKYKIHCDEAANHYNDLYAKHKTLTEKEQWYEEEMKRQAMEIMNLEKENRELKQNEINESKYEQWTWKHVLKWILSLNNGQYAKYETSLAQNLEQGKVRGSHLKWVNEIDLKSWGLVCFGDIKSLKQDIDR